MALLPDWLRVTQAGLWCEPGGFFVDPVQPVVRAVITHAHADHARTGHGAILATPETAAILRVRWGAEAAASIETVGYHQQRRLDGADVTLVPAGHVLGSAQVVMEHAGVRVVVSGDYKRRPDPTCPPFEPVSCGM